MSRDHIRFQQQPRPYGCMYYSLAALVDVPDHWAERFEEDCSVERMQIRLWAQGYGLWPVYVHPTATADREVWGWLVREHASQGQPWFDFQLAIESPSYRGVVHAVGLRLYFHDGAVSSAVVVDTSGHDAPQGFDWEGFLDSIYAEALDIRLVWPNEVERWAPVHGPDMPHVTGEVKQEVIDEMWEVVSEACREGVFYDSGTPTEAEH